MEHWKEQNIIVNVPDLLIDGKFYEVENYKPPFKKEKISNMINKGSGQSSRIIISNNKGASDRYISGVIFLKGYKIKTSREILMNCGFMKKEN
jgi:hypothetical protein